ncbi:MAG: secretin N-terminal domain-containing protein [Holosporales bacterium]|jgi:general secretion pathway protein D|nr:secretin N-terminal domain-containing protein [Holosporales bacterium]
MGKPSFFNYSALVCCAVMLLGCQHVVKSPLGKELTASDFKVLTSVPDERKGWAEVKPRHYAGQPQIPIAYRQHISVHVSRQIPLDIVLERIGQTLDVDIQIHKSLIEDKIFVDFAFTDKPFIEMLESVCSMAGLRYRILNKVLLIEKDAPFNKNYNVQFLNLTRTSQNNISSVTDIFVNSVQYGKKKHEVVSTTSNEGNGSNTSIRMNSENNFWNEVEVNLQTLLGPASCGSDPDNSSKSYFTIHKQAGIISIFGTSEQQYCVKKYLEVLQKSVSSQILIEAKVVEVRLNDNFKSGIEWGRIKPEENAQDHFSIGGNYAADDTVNANAAVPKGFFQYTANLSNGIYGLLKSLQFFGTTRTLSSPRLTVMNNQVAILKVARNHVYFKMNYNRHYYTKSDQSEVSVGSDIQTVPIGLVMSVQPAIDPINRNVILFLRPTISRLVDTVSDPSISIAHSSQKSETTVPESKVPIIEVKEVDSVLRLKDGEVAILGGLMETQSSSDRGVNPLFGKIPIVKELFSSASNDDRVTEIVILIKVKILDTPVPDEADERLVHFYTTDPRPFL